MGGSYNVGGLILSGGFDLGRSISSSAFTPEGAGRVTASAASLASNAVPEPTAALLFLVGGAGIAAQIRRQR